MRRSVILLCSLVLMHASWALAASFLPGTEDVPLMPGLSTAEDRNVMFDKPQGRIIEVTAEGALQRAQVLAFYRSSLPPLGWTEVAAQRFEREGERLSLDFAGSDGKLTVNFALAPL